MNELLNLMDYEHAARERLPEMVYGYYVSGANDEITRDENRAAFQRMRLRPRMLRGVSERDISVSVMGQSWPTPLITAPMAFMAMATPEGEKALARAAGARGVPMTLSTMSTVSLEDVAEVASAPLWFQLYVYKDRAVTRTLVERAEAAGYQALVLTVDTPLLGRREADIRNQFHLPQGLQAANLTHPSMQAVSQQAGDSGLSAYIASLWDAGLTWADVEWLQAITSLPVWVKGVLRGDDARLAVEHGAKGIIVSNHGGRQLDTAPATIDVLKDVVEHTAGRADVLMDGGVRRGTDVIKALTLGAQGVMLGRPLMWGLAVDGEAGAGHVLDLLLDEIDLGLALCGCRSVADLTPDLLF